MLRPDLEAHLPGFGVEIVNDFHVIGYETDRRHHYVFNPLSAQLSQIITNIRP